MPRPVREDGFDKIQRYAATHKVTGIKLLRVWVPDPDALGFRDEARRRNARRLISLPWQRQWTTKERDTRGPHHGSD